MVMDNSVSECHPSSTHGLLVGIAEETSGALDLEDDAFKLNDAVTGSESASAFEDELDAERSSLLDPAVDENGFVIGSFVDV